MESEEITSTIENDQSLTDQGNGRAEIANGQSSIVHLSADLSSEALAKGEASAKVNRRSSTGVPRRRRRSLGRKILSKEVLYPVLFALAIGAILVWRLLNGA